MLRQIRIFLSSPTDIAAERDCARRVVQNVLPLDPFIRNKVHLDIVSWDDPNAPATMPAHLSPQEAFDRGLPAPSDCDIVVVILWSRLGTPGEMRDGRRYESGTEFEYEDALTALRENEKVPPTDRKKVRSLLLYRNTREHTISTDLSDKDRTDAVNQRQAVLKFFARQQAEDGRLRGGINDYDTEQVFEKKLTYHLREEISRMLDEPRSSDGAEGVFFAPTFSNFVARNDAVATLERQLEQSSLLIVTGLSGNGKSFVVSQLATRLRDHHRRTTLWVNCEKDESLESLLARLAYKAAFRTQTTKAQCKELLAYLKATKSVLILDDYQACNQDSMSPLLIAATAQAGPASLVLVSRFVPIVTRPLPGVAVEQVSKFTKAEASDLLAGRGVVDISAAMVNELLEKTGALPLAMALFCGLVRSGADPARLLAGDLLEHDRLTMWFDELGRGLNERAAKLLGYLSLVDGAFDEAVTHLFFSGTSEHEVRRDFRALNQVFLVEKYGPNRWKVHDLVASVGRQSLPEEVIRIAYAELGRYYDEAARKAEILGDQDNWFEHLVKACRAFDRSGRRDDDLERALSIITPITKQRGANTVLLELSGNLVRSRPVTDLWTYYHYAHCCQILGLVDEAMQFARRILQSPKGLDATLRLSASRIYAEALAARGDLQGAHDTLERAIAATRTQRIRRTSLQQASSALAGMQSDLGKYDQALKNILPVLKRRDSIGKAVAMCRLGLIQLKQGNRRDAGKSFDNALSLFRTLRNPRGEAWALSGLVQVAFDNGDFAACTSYLRAVIPLQEQIGGYDAEYEQVIQRLRKADPPPALAAILEEEAARILQAKAERLSLTQRLKNVK